MGRLALLAFSCVPLMAQDVRLQAALRDHHDPEIQQALERAEARAGIWVASMSQSQQLLFGPAIVSGIFLNIELRVRNNQECSSTIGPPGKPPVTTCGPSFSETVVQGVDLDLAGDFIINPDGSPVLMGPEWQSMLGSQSIRVPDMALSGDHLHFSGTWERADCCALFPAKVPIIVDTKFSPDDSQLTGIMACDGKSEPVTFGRLHDSSAPFRGDWISQDGETVLFHIHNLGWGSNRIAASFDQINRGIFGWPFSPDLRGAELGLRLMAPTTLSDFTANVSADGSSMTGRWGFMSLGGNNFRRLDSSPVPQNAPSR